MSWGICEWYGIRVEDLSADERRACADDSLKGLTGDELGRECPFVQHLGKGALCNKKGGVCSIMPYSDTDASGPAAVCPRRLLAQDSRGRDVFDVLAETCFGVGREEEYAVIREVPFLEKIDAKGKSRGSKAGRIDWVLVAGVDRSAKEWMAVETQAVYFSGGTMDDDFALYRDHSDQLNVTSRNRRPDWRSSAAKRLAPQLDAKSPVMRRWGKKVAVVVDEGFYNEFAAFTHEDVDFDNSEIVWVVLSYQSDMSVTIEVKRFAELAESLDAIQATRPVRRDVFQKLLATNVSEKSEKVHFKRLP